MAKQERLGQIVEDSMACTAFAEVGEPCPVEVEVREELEQKNDPAEKHMDADCALFHEKGPQCFK